MPHTMSRALYHSLLHLHPAEFRERFAPEMEWIFDEVSSKMEQNVATD